MKTLLPYRFFPLMLCLWYLPGLSAKAQSSLSMDEAVQIALQQHPSVLNAAILVEEARIMRATAAELPAFQVNYDRGQINSAFNDYFWRFSQTAIAPFSFGAAASLWDERAKLRTQELAISRNRLRLEVKSIYQQCLFLYQRQSILQAQDSIYSDFYRAASLKYKSGESNRLSVLVAQTQSQSIQNQLQQTQADLQIALGRMQQVLNSEQAVMPNKDSLHKLPLPDAGNNAIEKHPMLQMLQQRKLSQQANTRYQRRLISPDILAGYFAQQLDKVSGFRGVTVGLAFPLYLRPYTARIKASRLQESISDNELNYNRFSLNKELEMGYQELSRHQKTLLFYENSALPQADLIAQNTRLSYQAGEIEYVEYVRNMSEVFQIRLAHAEALLAYNLCILRIEALVVHQEP